MYGLTRATTTLLAAAVAGFLIWLAAQFSNHHEGGYWAIMGVLAGAGLVMALSQLLGGWTKWGWPRLSASFFLFAFVPVAIVCLWVIVAGEPSNAWLHRHVLAWSSDIHVRGVLNDVMKYIPVFAFGTGLVFGFTFDTTGPVVRDTAVGRRAAAPPPVEDRTAADEPTTAERARTTSARDEEYAGARGRGAPPPE
ncbi:MAG: hypothetical protein E6G22_06305 [Actinobacteria bacterium]|nr:MAG: hypothetical protein E6G42_07710 [Actinomycetota bacterium]TML63404.1 MAG: hypothetical protein E6G22_06305 [Actinomycetota bacterium]